MNKYYLFVITVLTLTSCAIDPSRFVGPDGGRAYTMNCPPISGGLSACYRKAGELCWNGYRIIDQSSQVAGVMVMPVGTAFMGVPARRRSLTIECK
jgi:hypothetical protein